MGVKTSTAPTDAPYDHSTLNRRLMPMSPMTRVPANTTSIPSADAAKDTRMKGRRARCLSTSILTASAAAKLPTTERMTSGSIASG